MYVLVTSIVVFLSTSNILTVKSQQRIVGGTVASINNFPYQLSLHYRGWFLCGAVLITKSAALTGAHCVSEPFDRTYFSIRAGSSFTAFGGINLPISRIAIHPGYNSETFNNDIAVLLLIFPLYIEDNISPVKLPQANENPSTGQIAVVSGWGIRKPNNTHLKFKSIMLRKVELLIIDQNVCKMSFAPNAITNKMFCAGDIQGGKDACQGDSGGPLVSRGKLVGIVSWGIGCSLPNFPGVYTRISHPEIRLFIWQFAGI